MGQGHERPMPCSMFVFCSDIDSETSRQRQATNFEFRSLVAYCGMLSLFPIREQSILPSMQILSKRTLREFWTIYPHAKGPLSAWYSIVSKAIWSKPNDAKEQFGANVDFVGDGRAIFDIGGNKYRLVARIIYAPFYRVMVKFVGTHEEYDKINPETV
jgi:mRNA interferase HigB